MTNNDNIVDKQNVRQIAQSCAKDVGPSKYYAISILQSLDLPYTEADCISQTDNRNAKSEHKDIKVLSNYPIGIYNLDGRLIKKTNSVDEITTWNLPTGIYIMRTIDEEGNINSRKIFKL